MTSLGAMVMRQIPPENVRSHVAALDGRFDELWIVEDCFYAGGISQLTSVLAATSKSIVGHGIAPAPFRNPAALAMEWATLARMHPGRLAVGIGHGMPAWMDQIGESHESRVTLLRESIEATKALLTGETVSYDGRYVKLDDVRLQFPPAGPIPVSAGVRRPVSMRMSGEVADGTVIAEGPSPSDIARLRAQIDQGRAAAGRTDHHRLTAFVGFFIGELSELGPPPEDIEPGWAAIGDAATVADDIQEMIDTGIDSLVLVPFEDPASQLELALDRVVPSLKL
ncbi:MAG: LLM class flavin-dependent oxidoreductase [Acidimicrobiales bacterium]